MKRLFILSIDGVPYSLLTSLIDMGVMPFFKSLITEKGFRRYNSVLPTISSVAWASFMTGKNPGAHGIFGFIDRRPSPFKLYLPTGKNLRSKTLFEIVSDAGKRTISFNVPMTTPPRKVNGVMVSGFLSTKLHSAVHPPEIAQKLEYIGYIIDVDPSLALKDESTFWEQVYNALEGRKNAVKTFIGQEWDLFMLHIMETDRVNHFYIHNPEKLHSFYTKLDHYIKGIFEYIPDDADVLLLSDHGFCSIEKEFYVNTYLSRKGLLKFKVEDPKSLNEMDSSTIAYSLIPGRIYLNLKGREEMGSIPQGDYNRVRNEIVDMLGELVDNGIIKRVWLKEELYSGPFLDEAPDIILEPFDGIDIKGDINRKELFGKSSIKGMHTLEDAFILWIGKELKGNNSFSIIDIASSILDELGVGRPPDMEASGCLA